MQPLCHDWLAGVDLLCVIQTVHAAMFLITSLSAVFRQGDIGTSWYAVLSGSLDVKVSETANHQVRLRSRHNIVARVLLLCAASHLLPPPVSLIMHLKQEYIE